MSSDCYYSREGSIVHTIGKRNVEIAQWHPDTGTHYTTNSEGHYCIKAVQAFREEDARHAEQMGWMDDQNSMRFGN